MIQGLIESAKKLKAVWIIVLIIAGMVLLTHLFPRSTDKIVYNESLEEVIATVEGVDITLRDFAVYVAHQEAEVEALARVYDENPKKYWNLHTDGVFIRQKARDEALSMAIHDELFFQLSGEWELALSDEEKELVESETNDFWMDLTDEGKEERLGISKEDVYKTMEKIAIAEKCQTIYAKLNGVEYEQYQASEEYFLEFIKDYEYEVDEKLLDRLDFGEITLEH